MVIRNIVLTQKSRLSAYRSTRAHLTASRRAICSRGPPSPPERTWKHTCPVLGAARGFPGTVPEQQVESRD
ncbi:hypothetical protein CgunFtcFv8_009986 [Champsocephalus gunnari]|uniref:Uncharacterized protein n=1 Tax=Champsocephalus gunnari TaxID=52237 RepID=A0AAN8C3E8_CHAGU|nr:hypothetical protein CgunFtcFv8_009986 [Champsocephalus gunnari]